MATELFSTLDFSVLEHLVQPEPTQSLVTHQAPTEAFNPEALTTAIKQECSEEVLPFTLMALSQQTPPQQVTVRQSALHLRFMLLEAKADVQRVSELRKHYCVMAAQLETQRFQQLSATALSPWQHTGIDSYYDYQHHQLMARVEQSLSLLESQFPPPATATPVTPPAAPSELSPPLGYKKKTTHPLQPVAVRIMSNWYERNQEHPYPSYETAEVMAKAGNISVEQVKKWFANRRRREGNTKTLSQVAQRRKRARVDSCEILLPGGRD